MKGLTKILLLVCGTLCVALGILGIVLPLLPTTPFLLLAAACYARSSQRFYHWLITNRWCGAYIRRYRAGEGILLRQKIIAIALLWLTIGYSAIFAVSIWWVRLLLLTIAIGVSTHLVKIKTFRPAPAEEADLSQPKSCRKVGLNSDRATK